MTSGFRVDLKILEDLEGGLVTVPSDFVT